MRCILFGITREMRRCRHGHGHTQHKRRKINFTLGAQKGKEKMGGLVWDAEIGGKRMFIDDLRVHGNMLELLCTHAQPMYILNGCIHLLL